MPGAETFLLNRNRFLKVLKSLFVLAHRIEGDGEIRFADPDVRMTITQDLCFEGNRLSVQSKGLVLPALHLGYRPEVIKEPGSQKVMASHAIQDGFRSGRPTASFREPPLLIADDKD